MMLQKTPETDEEVMDLAQRSAFGYFERYTNPANGLVADTSKPGTPCSIAVVGFALSSYPVAIERGWIDRSDAAAIVLKTLVTLKQGPQSSAREAMGYKGLYYHFLDMDTGLRTWRSELSLIDSALLIAGVLTVSSYFDADTPEEHDLRTVAQWLYDRIDWPWARNANGLLSMGWRPGSGRLRYSWHGYTEALLLYIIAMGSLTRPLPPESYGIWGETYEWAQFQGMAYLHAGPLFIHLFSHAWIDFRGITDRFMRARNSDYFTNTQHAIAVHRDYAMQNPLGFDGYGADLWGLTACEGPSGRLRRKDGKRQRFFGYKARGAPYGPDDGTIAPFAALACLPFAPDLAMTSYRHMIATYPTLLVDGMLPASFNPSLHAVSGAGDWQTDHASGLDQGLLVMMIENHRSGLIWQLIHKNPVISRGMKRAGFEGGWLDGSHKT